MARGRGPVGDTGPGGDASREPPLRQPRRRRIEPLVADLNRRIRDEGLELEVRPGAEVALLGSRSGLDAEELRPASARRRAVAARRAAHGCRRGRRGGSRDGARRPGPPRAARPPGALSGVPRDPGVLAALVGEGVLASVTAASLRGHFGEEVARFALELVRSELIHNVASDAHHHELRPPTMLGELERAGLGPLGGVVDDEASRGRSSKAPRSPSGRSPERAPQTALGVGPARAADQGRAAAAPAQHLLQRPPS